MVTWIFSQEKIAITQMGEASDVESIYRHDTS